MIDLELCQVWTGRGENEVWAMRQRMTNVDVAWLEMDRPVNPMVINGVMIFREPINRERVLTLVEGRLLRRFARFRQRVVEWPLGTRQFFWEDDPDFDVRRHVQRVKLAPPGDKAALKQLIQELMAEGLDRQHPLWQFYLIENYNGGSALFSRIHHCIADGIALIQVLMSLTDTSADPVTPVLNLSRSAEDNSMQMCLQQAVAGVGKAWAMGKAVWSDPAGTLRSAGLTAATSAAILAKLALLGPDLDSVFRGELNGVKRVAWSEPMPLADVKEMGRLTQSTVNDVLTALIAGALRGYFCSIGNSVDGEPVRAMTPVNLRPPSRKIRLGNEFGLVYLSLPTHVADRQERLMAAKQRMAQLKRSPEAVLVYQILHILGMMPSEKTRLATDWFSSKASCVLTNVPGPRQTIYLAGKPIDEMMFWVPQSGSIGVGISIISYAGDVIVGVMVDEGLIREPDAIIHALHIEFDDLRREILGDSLSETTA